MLSAVYDQISKYGTPKFEWYWIMLALNVFGK